MTSIPSTSLTIAAVAVCLFFTAYSHPVPADGPATTQVPDSAAASSVVDDTENASPKLPRQTISHTIPIVEGRQNNDANDSNNQINQAFKDLANSVSGGNRDVSNTKQAVLNELVSQLLATANNKNDASVSASNSITNNAQSKDDVDANRNIRGSQSNTVTRGAESTGSGYGAPLGLPLPHGAIVIESAPPNPFAPIVNTAGNFVNQLTNAASNTVGLGTQVLGSLLGTAANILQGTIQAILNLLQAKGQLVSGVVNSVGPVVSGVTQTVGNVVAGGARVLGSLTQGIARSGTGLVNSGAGILEGITRTAGDLAQTGANIIGGILTTKAQLLGNIVNQVTQTVTNTASALAGAKAGVVNGLIGSVTHGLNTIGHNTGRQVGAGYGIPGGTYGIGASNNVPAYTFAASQNAAKV